MLMRAVMDLVVTLMADTYQVVIVQSKFREVTQFFDMVDCVRLPDPALCDRQIIA